MTFKKAFDTNVMSGKISINKRGMNSFYHYTSFDNAKKILTPKKSNKPNNFFYVSSLGIMNDVNEKNLHIKDKNNIFVFSTCNSNNERIPLWYLYAGICGKGVGLGFLPTEMFDFINGITTVYPVNENNKPKKENPLLINEDFELTCGWVFYVDKENEKDIKVKYKSNKEIISLDDYNKLEESKNNCFIKDYPWEYESEFRIVIKTKTNYNRLAIPIPNKTISNMMVKLAPECSDKEKSFFTNADTGIKEENISDSKLKIKMELLKRNKTDFIDNLNNWCGVEDYKKMCNAIKLGKKCKYKEPRQ